MSEVVAPLLTGIFSLATAIVTAWLSHYFSLRRSNFGKKPTSDGAVHAPQPHTVSRVGDSQPAKVLDESLTPSGSVLRQELIKDISNIALRNYYLSAQSFREKLKDRDRAIICWTLIFLLMTGIGTFIGMSTGHAAPYIFHVNVAPGEPYFSLKVWAVTFVTVVALLSLGMKASVGYITVNSIFVCLISASVGGALGGIVYSLIGGRDTDIGGLLGGLISTLGFLIVFYIVNGKKLKSYGPIPFGAYFVPFNMVKQIFVFEEES